MAVPEVISWLAIDLASLTGIAKPIPMLPLWVDELPRWQVHGRDDADRLWDCLAGLCGYPPCH